jgi:Ca-activated chloride channel family protein
MFLLFLAIPLLLVWRLRRKGRPALRFPSTADAARLPRSLRLRLVWTPLALRVLAVVALIVALARPQAGTERMVDVSRGVAIEMVVDRSSSMAAEFRYGGQSVNRLDVALRLFQDFVKGGGGLEGRPADLIGLITFARYADTVCPLTLDHDTLAGFLPTVKLVSRESEDGTAIGDAVALAGARLRTAEEVLARQAPGNREYEIKSKVVILLTDGENNAGKRSVQEAADLCAGWGIRVYAIGIGGEGATTIRSPLGTYSIPMGGGVDEKSLRALAETTGGLYRVAGDAQALQAVYEEIDRLEKTEFESARFLDYRELFVPFAWTALGALVGEALLAATIFRRAP